MTQTFVCVLRSGGIYNATHVLRLRNNLREVIRGDFWLMCFTDMPVPSMSNVDIIGLLDQDVFPGWWAKLQVFRVTKAPCVYIDLDTLILRDPRPLFEGNGFYMTPSFVGTDLASPESSVMAWSGNYFDRIVKEYYRRGPEKVQREFNGKIRPGLLGDQGFIYDVMGKDVLHFHPGQCVSYKTHARIAPPSGAVTVTFHGKPKPEDAGGWATEEWNRLLE